MARWSLPWSALIARSLRSCLDIRALARFENVAPLSKPKNSLFAVTLLTAAAKITTREQKVSFANKCDLEQTQIQGFQNSFRVSFPDMFHSYSGAFRLFRFYIE
jgi:hypothetical protein